MLYLKALDILVEVDKAITEWEVHKLEKVVNSYDFNWTDEERMISAKPAKRSKRLKKALDNSCNQSDIMLLHFDDPGLKQLLH